MKTFLAACLLFCLAFNAKAQTDTTYIPFVAYWAVGDSFAFQVTKIDQKFTEQGNLLKSDTSIYKASLLVADSTESTYTVRWKFGEEGWRPTGLSDRLAGLLQKQKIGEVVYTTNELGEFVQIENLEEISGKFKTLVGLATLAAKLDRSGPTLAGFREKYTTREGIETKVFEELIHLHFPFGREYATNTSYSYRDFYGSLFDGKPIRVDVEVFVKSYSLENERCVLIQKSKMNEEDVKKMLEQFFTKSGLGGKEMRKKVKNAVFDVSDTIMYDYFFYPGTPIRVEKERVFEMGGFTEDGAKVVERIIIELQR